RRAQFARTKSKSRPAQAGEMRLDPLEALLNRDDLCEARADDLKSGFGGNAGRILEHAIHKTVSARREFLNCGPSHSVGTREFDYLISSASFLRKLRSRLRCHSRLIAWRLLAHRSE